MADLTKENIENILELNDLHISELAYLAEHGSIDENSAATLSQIIIDILELEE